MSLPWTHSSEPSNPKTARLHGLGITLLWKEYHLKWQLHKGYKETNNLASYICISYIQYFYGKKYLLGNIASYHFGCYLGTRWVTLTSFHQVHEGKIHQKASDQLVFLSIKTDFVGYVGIKPMNRTLRTKYHKYLPCKGQGWPIWWHLLLVTCFLESWWWCTYTDVLPLVPWPHLTIVPLIHSTGAHLKKPPPKAHLKVLHAIGKVSTWQ